LSKNEKIYAKFLSPPLKMKKQWEYDLNIYMVVKAEAQKSLK
tara:strand:- start:156 stop:281 length:126 start_codon:yes stop_codon:yes gene_type:complete